MNSTIWDMIDDCNIKNLELCFCRFSFARYSQKYVTQIYRALYGDAMFVPFGGTQTWRAVT